MSDLALDLAAGNGAEPRRLRVRLVSVVVQLEVVADDGDTLHPVETQGVRVPASEWHNWHLDMALAQLQEQIG
jgi:hypothetical protein